MLKPSTWSESVTRTTALPEKKKKTKKKKKKQKQSRHIFRDQNPLPPSISILPELSQANESQNLKRRTSFLQQPGPILTALPTSLPQPLLRADPSLEASRAPVLELHTDQLCTASPLGLGSSPPPEARPAPSSAPARRRARDPGSGIGDPGTGNRERGSAMPKHEFFVDMTCEGCSNAVTRVLHRLGGVNFDIDLPNKKVYIDSEHNVDTLLETLKKTGKNASYLGEKSAQ
uniref:Copper transport protein ATOX1 n=2 Tax=Estrildinae TaxID=40155 RepID=H0YR72_TAEGU